MVTTLVLDVRSARARGIGERRLRGRSYERITSGAYLPAADATSLRRRCQALVSVMPAAVLSHWTAAALLGLPLPPGRQPEPFHVLVPAGVRAPRRAGVVAHTTIGAVPQQRVGELSVTDPVRTWCDLARDGADLGELVVVGDAVARARPVLVPALHAAVGAGAGRRGVRTARRAMSLLDGRSESPMESLLRVLVTVPGLPRPAPQHVVVDAAGWFLARVDLAWPEHRLVVEYDGAHHRDAATWRRDLRRRERLEDAGWRVLVVTAHDLLGDPTGTLARITRALHG